MIEEAKSPTTRPDINISTSERLIDTKVAEEQPLIPPKSVAPLKLDKDGKPEPEPRSTEERNRSFKFIMGYARRECCSIFIGIIFLILGSMSDLTVPFFIGKIVDLLSKGEYDAVNKWCIYMLLIIVVSCHYLALPQTVFFLVSKVG